VIWLKTRQQLFQLSATDKSLQLSDGQLRAVATVRNLGVQIDKLSFDSQSRSCSKGCMRWINYCNTILIGAPRTVIDKLQRVLNAAARVITGTRKFDRGLGQILHDELHSLDVPDRVIFKLAVTVHRRLNGRAPPYLMDYCIPVSGANTGRCLRSANRHILAVRRFPLNTYIRPPGLFSCRSYGLKLSPGFHPGPSDQYRLFQTCSQNEYLFVQY